MQDDSPDDVCSDIDESELLEKKLTRDLRRLQENQQYSEAERKLVHLSRCHI